MLPVCDIRIKVKASSSVNLIEQTQDGWRLKIKAPPVEGKANKEIIEYLSKILKTPKTTISIKSGQKNPYKTVRITGMEKEFCEKLFLESNQ